jgi:hypothetical protein
MVVLLLLIVLEAAVEAVLEVEADVEAVLEVEAVVDAVLEVEAGVLLVTVPAVVLGLEPLLWLLFSMFSINPSIVVLKKE